MTDDQKVKCHAIIHSSAAAAAAGNLVPIPGTGVAVDTVAMTAMCMSLCAVFGGNIAKEVATGMAISALKSTMLKQPIKVITKEVAKLIPFLGQFVSPAITVVIIEAAGWTLATDLERKCQS